MSNIENEVVSMHFDNEGFERNISATLQSLEKLTQTIQMASAKQGLTDLSHAADSFNISSMAQGIDNISSKFSALGAIGFSAIQKITGSVIDFVKGTADDILGPIITGGKRRAENIEQAKFQFRGLGLDVEAEMAAALAAVKGTSFGLDEAAKAAAQFGASGIAAGDDLTASLRAIAGTAAMTNTSFGEIAQIFTSSAGAGKVNNQDLLQFATRGLNASAAIAKQMNITEAQVHEMAAAGKLDFLTFAKAMDSAFGEHATAANETYSGSLANMHAAMSRLGASFFAPKAEQMRDIFNALTPVIDNISSALQPLIQTFIKFGQVGTFKLVAALGKLDLGNFKAAILYISSGLQNLSRLVGPLVTAIKNGFREIFPKATESRLVSITFAFNYLTEKIKIGGDLLDKVKRIFKGFFSVLSIGATIISSTVGFIAGLVQELFQAAGFEGSGILDFFVNFADSLTNLQKKLVAGGGIHDFFVKLHGVIEPVITALATFREKVSDLFGGRKKGDSKDTEETFDRLGQRMEQLKDAADHVSSGWKALMDRFEKSRETIDRIWQSISTFFKDFADKIAGAFHPGDFDSVIDILNVALFGGIILLIRNFFKDDKSLGLDFSGGLIDKIKFSLTQITNGFKTMQLELKADILLKLAEAILAITASVVILSLIDSAALAKALSAMAVGFGELAAAFVSLDKLTGSSGDAAKVGIISAAMIAMAGAMVIFGGAIAILAAIEPAALARGVVAVGISLGILVSATHIIGEGSARLIVAGAGMTALAFGLTAIAGSISVFATLDLGTLAHGLLGITAALFTITVAMSEMPINLPITAAGVGVLSVALLGMYEAVRVFGGLDWGVMGKGLLGIAGALLVVTVAMDSMPLTLPITAAGMVVLSGALIIMGKAINDIGSLDAGVIAKGIGSIAAILLVLDAAMQGMETALPGAAALVLVSGALLVLGRVLDQIGNMDSKRLVQALLGIAGVLAIIGGAAALIGPVVPVLIGLAFAFDLLAGAMLLFGAGSLLFAKSMDIMSRAGLAGTKAIVESIKEFITAIPGFVKALVLSFVDNIDEIIKAIPLVIRLIEAVISQLLDTMIKLAPKIGQALVIIITELFKVLRTYYPELIKTGLDLLLHLLQGVRDNIGEITTLVAEIIVNFLNALTEKVPELVDALYNFLHTVIVEVVRKISEEIPSLTIDIGTAMIDGFLTGLEKAAGRLYDFFSELPGRILDIVKSFLGIQSPSTKFAEIGVNIIEGLLNGLIGAVGSIFTWFTELPGNIIGWIGDVGSILIDKGVEIIGGFIAGYIEKAQEIVGWFAGLPGAILGWIGDVADKLKNKGIDLIEGLFKGILEKAEDIKKWFLGFKDLLLGWLPNPLSILSDFGKSIVDGLTGGIELHSTTDSPIADAVRKLADTVSGTFQKKTGISSPSKVFFQFGKHVVEGLINGINDMRGLAKDASSSLGENITDGFNPDVDLKSINSILAQMTDKLGSMDNFNPVITPVLDLSKVQKESDKLSNFMKVSSIVPEVSFDHAKLISATADIGKTSIDAPVQAQSQDISFVQNIHAPEALSTVDIYRNTKSLMSKAKEELNI